jgi:alkylhydroperoxidase/carboxymuconolactone decarboxylase family protein YurZ
MEQDDPTSSTEAPGVTVPAVPADVATEHKDVWEAYQRLGEAISAAGPLDARSRRLVHLALAIAAGSEGATHSHVRRALSEGLSSEELDQVALLAITTLGWPRAVRGLTWIRDITRK